MKANRLFNSLIATAALTGIFFSMSSQVVGSEDSLPSTLVLKGTIRDFQDTHPDFESVEGDDRGIVTIELGEDNKPVYAHGEEGTLTTTGPSNFNQWYNDVEGVNQSIEHFITLTRQEDGTYKYQNHQFFPINGKLWGNYQDDKNYHFTYEIHNRFTYQGGEVFEFSGDDDVWVYIDGKRIIDIGGVHLSQSQSADLDELVANNVLDLTIGETYDFAFFFAERHYSESNFTITTNIELETTLFAD